MSMNFGKTNGTEGLLKLTKFGFYTLVFGDIWPDKNFLRSNRNKAICYVDDTSLRRNARPVMHWLLANASMLLVAFISYVSFCVYSCCDVSTGIYRNNIWIWIWTPTRRHFVAVAGFENKACVYCMDY